MLYFELVPRTGRRRASGLGCLSLVAVHGDPFGFGCGFGFYPGCDLAGVVPLGDGAPLRLSGIDLLVVVWYVVVLVGLVPECW